jgi:phage shock protein E
MNWTFALIVGAVVVTLLVVKRVSLVSAEVARKHLQAGALVIDVRSPEEFADGHLPNAVNVPLGTLSEALPRLAQDKGQVLLLHCLSGTRSGFARQQARRMGYTQVFNLGSYGRAQQIVGASRSP